MTLDLKVQCPELLEQITGFPSDGMGTALPDILQECHRNGRSLRTALGWQDDDSTMEETCTSNLEEKFMLSAQLVKSMLPEEHRTYVDSNPQALFDNVLQSGMKVSKFLARYAASNQLVPNFMTTLCSSEFSSTVGDTNFFSRLKNELPKYSVTNLFHLCLDPMTFVQNFYSEISTYKSKAIGFTIDPLLMVRGANSPNYKSCYTIEREYNSSAPFTLARSGHAGMIYIKTDQSVLGRSWVIFSPTFDSFFILKSYGFLPMEHVKQVASWLCGLLNKDVEWSFKIYDPEDDQMSFHTSLGDTGVYEDPVIMAYTCREDKAVEFSIVVPPSRCVLCGKSTRVSRIFCPQCRDSRIDKCYMHSCDHLILDKQPNTVGFCGTCSKKYTKCPSCGRIHLTSKECECKKDSTMCMFCNQPATISLNGVGCCAECASILTTADTCSVCGEHGLMYPVAHQPVCQLCFVAATATDRSIMSNLPVDIQHKLSELRRLHNEHRAT